MMSTYVDNMFQSVVRKSGYLFISSSKRIVYNAYVDGNPNPKCFQKNSKEIVHLNVRTFKIVLKHFYMTKKFYICTIYKVKQYKVTLVNDLKPYLSGDSTFLINPF